MDRKVKPRDDTSSAAVRYNGLRNPSRTYCYLNCILQPLFMTREFRDAVKSTAAERPEYIDKELASLFEKLEEDTSSPSDIITKLGVDSVTQQQDAAEYLEQILSLTSPTASQIFRGQLSRTITCSTCQTETGNDGPFWLLHIEMRNSKSLKKAFECLFRRLKLKKENQVYCQKCGVKRDATIRAHVSSYPNVLMLLLKRLETEHLMKSKCGCFSVYKTQNCRNNDPHVKAPLKLKREGHHYELYGFVQHFGNLAGGHYTATIKAHDRWFTFNDENVYRDVLDCQRDYVTLRNAYLLFYQKKQYNRKQDSHWCLGISNECGCFVTRLKLNTDTEEEGRGQEDC
ncbi:ubiquitin carboxyl-terminal hydrolase 47-like isoform X2 [Synchiropus splendidus]|uniref:ubiquitin carboxyl-terminal hydrolase 47-like isoform X2 n=1 Tax=Synchiropus splendidus TaxID=270530 RepID=UPI00237E1C03|nr:ubiquitin carboxyl-terminal hydrolase 47-like isoform X2 [Synchiropus splendidus]